ncbi:GGDEF domain-containing protein [Marinomonas pollencensis]|uniref:GGDEF domain-containing protein n=1 Tax=Marinomonas pollencensis TaxID=491954 RepID=A0A3E0DLH4_9GAMM|nr:GGDEF domain-containing protein [Marinomonas pollencensis]REG83648.1 GGDEF domain-containing protein [Marinomonas pollencensis]
MAFDALPLDIQELQTRLLQTEKERELLARQNAEMAQHLRSIAEGKSISFFWDQVLDDCKRDLPNAYVTLLAQAEQDQEWHLVRHDDTNIQLLTPNSSEMTLPPAVQTFTQSPSCSMRHEANIHQSADWSMWHAFLSANHFSDVVLVNINEPYDGAYLMLLFGRGIASLDAATTQCLTRCTHLIEAAALREQADRLLLEASHFDPQTGLLRAFSFQHNFSIVLKDSRRHFMRVALISLKLRSAVGSNDDALLKDVAAKIQTAIRDNDLVAYYGEGEFVMGVCIRHMQDAEVIASKLIDVLTASSETPNRLTKEGVRIGIAYYPEHSTLDDLYRASGYATNSVAERSGYRIEFHGALYTSSAEFYTF